MASAPKRLHSFLAIAAIAVLQYAAPAAAQWLNYPNPGIPRTADGKPNLSAATPKMADAKPDLSGVWIHQRGQNQPPRNEVGQPGTVFDFMPPGSQISLQPWAEALYKERAKGLGAGRPTEHCLPHGIPDAMMYGGPMKIVQTPALMLILYEELSHFRQVYTDGRGAPRAVLPAWYGYSSGKWVGAYFAARLTRETMGAIRRTSRASSISRSVNTSDPHSTTMRSRLSRLFNSSVAPISHVPLWILC